MKKISVLIIVLFMINIFMIGNVFAANVCKISANFNPSNPYQGNEVTIKISASEITEDIAAVGFTLNYDSDVFEFSGTEKADGWTIIPIEGIQFTIHTDSYEATRNAGTIGTIKLKVKNNAKLGNTLIKISGIEVAKDDSSTIKIGDLEQNILIQKEESNNTNTNTNDNTNTNANANTNTSTNISSKENVSTSTEKKNTTTNNEKANTKAENKKTVLPYTGKAHLFIGSVLVIASIFVIISYNKYLKYKNI